MNLLELNEKIQAIDIFSSFEQLVKDNPTVFTDFLREQWESGIHGDNQTFTYSSKKYAERKFEQNPKASGRVDLILTGQLEKGIYFETFLTDSNVEIKFTSTDEKSASLTKKYSGLIWEYNDATINKATDFIIKNIKDYIL